MFNLYLRVKRLKRGLRKYRWAGFGVGKFVRGFELLNWEIVLYTVVFELVSESMLDEVLARGDSCAGKQKVV